jgi:hypothetical protein
MIKKIKKLVVRGAKTEAKENFKFDQERRDNAVKILNPNQVQGKTFRVTKLLETTLGLKSGEPMRAITRQDLQAFKRNIKTAQNRVKKGLTANDVIRFSTKADKDRSKKQIHMAIPIRMKGGDINFLTDAGPESRVSRHHVKVILNDYEKGLSVGTPLQAAKAMAKSGIKFDCDCEHHTFVFRYITTIMGANAGRAETGFPKIRNPKLLGIACKHVLRVMVELSTSIFIWKKIARMVESDRKGNVDKTRRKQQKVISISQKEANELARKQQKNKRKIAELIKKVPKPKKTKTNTSADITRIAKQFNVDPDLVEQIQQQLQSKK